MCKHLLAIAIFLFCSLYINAQTIIQYKGSNTWGGPYVPPVWTKTYNQTLKTYNINVQPASSPKNQSNSGGTGSASTLVKKTKWAFASSPVDYEALENRRIYKNKKAKEVALSYAKNLNEAISMYNSKFYRGCYNTITRIMTSNVLDEIKKHDNSDEVYKYIGEYEDVKNYYKFMSGVKCGATDNSQFQYRMYLTPDDKYVDEPGVPDVSKPYPYIPRYYYFLDTINAIQRAGFAKYSISERFMADLYFVESLADLGRKEEGNKIFNSVLNFYLPKVESVEAFLPQIAINHFYLDNVNEASDLLEYYWNETESYTARLEVLNELVIGDGFLQKNKWSREKNHEAYAFVKKNYVFLDSIITARKLDIQAYNSQVKYTLLVTRGKEYDDYLRTLEPTIKQSFDSLYASKYFGYTSQNNDVERYLLVLLEKGDQDKIREILQRVYEVAIKKKNLMLAQVDVEIKKAYQYKNAPGLYWEVYYHSKSDPAANALVFFAMKDFAKAGGKKYLREIARPLLDELSDYTKEESRLDTHILEDCGIKPDFLKKRKYQDAVPVSQEETNEKIALQNKKELDEKNKLQAIENKRTQTILAPLTQKEEEFKAKGVPFAALAMFEYALQNKINATQTLFDSANLEYASICFQNWDMKQANH